MHACLAMLVGMSLLCNTDSLQIDHHREPVKGEEDVTMIRGVPVYNYRMARAQTNQSSSIEIWDDDEEYDWIYLFDTYTEASDLEDACRDEVVSCTSSPNVRSGEGIHFITAHSSVKDVEKTLMKLHIPAKAVDYNSLVYADSIDAQQDFSKYLIDETSMEGAATWGLNAINKDTAASDGFGVHAYVYDTGVRTTHAEFGGRGIPTLDAVTGQLIVCSCMNTSCATDRHGHGTHCAGTIGGKTYGVAPNARIHAVKVLSDTGSGYTSWQILCHNWMITYSMRPAVVSMSLGGSGNNQASKSAIDSVIAAGITVVVAAGNSAIDACSFTPAFIPDVITVGSTTSGNTMSYFSNYGTCLDLWAPGSSVISAGIVSDTATRMMSGTSMACPHVAGGVAIMQDLLPTITPTQVITQLLAGATTGLITGIPANPVSPNVFLQVNSLNVPRGSKSRVHQPRVTTYESINRSCKGGCGDGYNSSVHALQIALSPVRT